MKTAYKSIIAIFLVSLLVSLLPVLVAEAQAETSYIIVHAHNPEGVEIASILWMDQLDVERVEIYDDNTLIGYGANNTASHNMPIAISSGTHNIKAKFNGMTKEQIVTLNNNETKTITFTFERISKNFEECWYLEPLYTLSASGSSSGYYDIYRTSIFDEKSIFDCSPEGKYTGGSITSYVSTGGLGVIYAELSGSGFFSIDSHSFTYNAQLSGSWIGYPPTTVPIIGISISVYTFEYVNIPVPVGFDKWIKQITAPEDCDCYGKVFFINPPYTYNTFFQLGGGVGFEEGSKSEFWKPELDAVLCSVPYDLTGTGVKDGENQPPVASFTYSPENPGINKEITFDASSSHDPDGTIVNYRWDFGDDAWSEGVSTKVNHAYNHTDQYTVTLTVIDDTGLSDVEMKTISIRQCNTLNPKFKEILLPPCNKANKGKVLWEKVAESGERLIIECVDRGDIHAYVMYYVGFCGNQLNIVGKCHYNCGFNYQWYSYADDNFNGEPDCFLNTDWISKDYGSDDDSNGYLDWYEHFFDVASCKTTDYRNEFVYRCPPPVISKNACLALPENPCCQYNVCDPPEGDRIGYSEKDPPLGPETDAYYWHQIEALRNYSPEEIVMVSPPFVLGDLDGDGDLDEADYQMLRNLIGICRDETTFNPFADMDKDGCITESDLNILFRAIPATIRIEPETLNLASEGVFTAFIQLIEGYNVANIDVSTVLCEGAPAVKGMVSEEDSGTYIAKFNRQDLVNVPTGDAVTLRLTGKVRYNGGLVDFEGSDTIRVIDQGKGKK